MVASLYMHILQYASLLTLWKKILLWTLTKEIKNYVNNNQLQYINKQYTF